MRQTEPRLNNKRVHTFVCVLCSVFWVLSSCASPSVKLPEPPVKYVYEMEEPQINNSTNSLWSDTGNIFEDRKARRLNDLVTIIISESLSGSGTADTETSRESSLDVSLDELLGMNKTFDIHKIKGIEKLYQSGQVFTPEIRGSAESDFKGEGDTNREGSIDATVTAKVVEVMPNGNLMLEARKELTINNEKQILVLSGMARTDDIQSDNTILSIKLADARVFYIGDGVINDKQKPGWLVRIVDNVWPF